MTGDESAVGRYMATYGLSSAMLQPAGADGRDEAGIVADADIDYELNRHGAFRIRAEECALLVIDLQQGFVEPSSPMWVPHATRILPSVTDFARVCRGLQVPVIFTAATYLPDQPNDTKRYCAPVADGWLAAGAPSSQVASALAEPQDVVVESKHTYNAFFGTELDALLRERGVTTAIVTGTLTNFCCEATARAAFDLGYHVVFCSDLTATDSATAHRATLRTLRRGYARVMLARDVESALHGRDEQYDRDSRTSDARSGNQVRA
jgi:nicotinamidase-related amidase